MPLISIYQNGVQVTPPPPLISGDGQDHLWETRSISRLCKAVYLLASILWDYFCVWLHTYSASSEQLQPYRTWQLYIWSVGYCSKSELCLWVVSFPSVPALRNLHNKELILPSDWPLRVCVHCRSQHTHKWVCWCNSVTHGFQHC